MEEFYKSLIVFLSVMTQCHIILYSGGQANHSETVESFSLPQQPSGPLLWFVQDGGRLCVVVVPRGGEKQVARSLKNWWMMINSCERVKLIQTVWHNKWGQSYLQGFQNCCCDMRAGRNWTGFSRFCLLSHQSTVQTGSKTRCHTGLWVWPLLSWRWCTALSNLFITPRFLLYVSSIFHDRGVNHQQHPVFFSHERLNMLVYLCRRPESQLTHRSGSNSDWRSPTRHTCLTASVSLVWLKLFERLYEKFLRSWFKHGDKTLSCVLFLFWDLGFNTAGFHHWGRTSACVTPAITTIPMHQSSLVE